MSRKKRLRKLAKIRKSKFRRAKLLPEYDVYDQNVVPPHSQSVLANHDRLAHNNTYGAFPYFYIDKIITCRDCGKEELWEARQQQWWYEIAKGNINSQAVRCRSCRRIENKRKADARRIHLAGIKKKMGDDV